jgi:fatty-acyl-CoA synthase
MWLGIGDAIEHWARYKPNKTALRIGGRIYDYRALYERAISIGIFITESKVEGRVGVGVDDKFEYLASIAALNLVGNPIVILNPHPTQESLTVHLRDTKPDIIIGHSDLIHTIEKVANRSLQTMNILEIQIIKNRRPLARINSKEWGILFSSGSTGISKAIVYDHSTMLSELVAWCLELGIRRETRFYIGRPIYYTGGLVLTLATLLVGGEAILPEHQDDNDFETIWSHYQKCVADGALDLAFFIPDQLRTFMRVAKEPLGGPTILVMGARISGDEKKNACRMLKSPLIESWGNSEGLGTITDKEDLFSRPDSIGRPFLTEKVCIVSDKLVECEPDQRGRLAGSEENMFVEYANRPESTERVKRNNLILSDDIGYMDENYYFYILGRDQESFVVGEQTVFLSDMEERLRKVTGVIDICIVAMEAKCATAFYALIVSKKNVSKDSVKMEIQNALNEKLYGYLFVEALPRLSSGKIDRLGAAKLVNESI